MKVAIIINGISRKKKFFYKSVFPALRDEFGAEVFETQHAQHAIALAAGATEKNFDFVLAAGGDGTLNQVVNGVLKGRETQNQLPAIGVIPLGTGNDFARLCNTRPDAGSIQRLLLENKPKKTDVGKITCRNEDGKIVEQYFLNVCSLGMGPEVVRRLYKSNRSLGPGLTYFKAITETFLTHKAQEVAVTSDRWEWSGRMRVVAIANGQSFGHGLYVGPDALPDDGIFSTFIAGDLPLWKFLLYLQKIKTQKKINDRQFHYNEAGWVEITSPLPCALEAEGEWAGWLPARIEIIGKRIGVLR